MILTIIIAIFAVIGWVCCYINGRRLKQWSDFCKHGRIFIAHRGKTVVQAPVTEWVLWAKQLNQDEQSKGRVIYRENRVTVGIARAQPPEKVKRKWLPDRKPSAQKAQPNVVKEGRYTAKDETPKVVN